MTFDPKTIHLEGFAEKMVDVPTEIPPKSCGLPSGYVKIAMERSTIFHGKIHYFDWAIFNSYVKLPEGISLIYTLIICLMYKKYISLGVRGTLGESNLDHDSYYEHCSVETSWVQMDQSTHCHVWLPEGNEALWIIWTYIYIYVPWSFSLFRSYPMNVPYPMTDPCMLNIW